MPPLDPTSQQSATQNNPLNVMQPGEQVVADIKRHPIGMIRLFVLAGVILIALAVFCLVIGPSVLGGNGAGTAIGAVLFILLAALTVVFVLIANIVYWGNRWVVTSDSITQVQQTSLFHKQSAQLSLGNLEDVTVDQNGILTHIFNFGVLKAETAGERSKFVLSYCPNPNKYAQIVLHAREAFESAHHGGKVYNQVDRQTNAREESPPPGPTQS
jgi:hypothetical protein